MKNDLNYKFTVSYKGSGYCGWQTQPQKNTPSIQGTIQSAIENAFKLSEGYVKIDGSGRTDAGVHAYAQVFSVRLPSLMECSKMVWLFNRFLPDDICIETCEKVEDSFHARYCAVSKAYTYRIYLSEKKNPFEADTSWHYFRYFDVSSAREAIELFVGEHDFSAFMSSGSDKTNTVRTVYEAYIKRDKNGSALRGDEEIIEIYFRGNGFLYNMVRNMVGLISEVATGRISIERAGGIMMRGVRTKEIITAPSHGLYLTKVDY